jgi:hypothetical protein
LHTRSQAEFGDGSKHSVQAVLELRIRPGTFSIGQETVGAAAKMVEIDPHFRNDQLEWCVQACR